MSDHVPGPPAHPDDRTVAWETQPGAPDPAHGRWMGQVETAPRDRRPPVAVGLLAVALVVLIGAIVGYLLFAGGLAPGTSPSPTPPSVAVSPAPPSPGVTATPGAPGTPATTPSAPGAPATPEPGASPGATPSPPPTTPPVGTPAVGRTPPPDVAAQIDEVVRHVPALRELEPLRDVPYVFLSRDEFQGVLAELLEEEVDRELLATEQRLLARLNLLPDDVDLYELLLQLYGSQIAAYYRPDTGSFYVIERDEPFGAMDRMIVAHEYTHALQDQHYDLEGTRITDPSEGDAVLAQVAAIEGDASLVMFRWALTSLNPEQLLELFAGAGPTPTDEELLELMPDILRRQLAFPYNEGFLFTTEIESEGGWQAVNETLADPPASTEQILHPDKYLAGEEPVALELADPLPQLGEGWVRRYEQTMGELNIQVWLADGEDPPLTIPGLPSQPTDWQAAAAGWAGDRLEMFEGPDGSWLIVWVTAWDSAAEADEFVAAADPLLDGLDGPALLFETFDTEVTLYVARSQQILEMVPGGD